MQATFLVALFSNIDAAQLVRITERIERYLILLTMTLSTRRPSSRVVVAHGALWNVECAKAESREACCVTTTKAIV